MAGHRQLPIGAEVRRDGGTHFRVWAPRRRRVEVVLEAGPRAVELGAEGNGYFSGVAPAPAGSRYRFRLDDGPDLYPDPASRFQPAGPHELSEVIDPTGYQWQDGAWGGLSLKGQVLYELHVGTFTAEGVSHGQTSGVRGGPVDGTYFVNADCTGGQTTFIPGVPPLEDRFVIVDDGREVRTVVISPLTTIASANLRKK